MTATLARPATRPVAHTTRKLLRAQATPAAFFWAIVLVAVVTLTAILAATGITHVSVVSFARQAGIWFPFSLQIFVATGYLRAHVAAGMTRRTLTWAALAVAVTVGVVNALIMSTALLVERLIHEALGWDWVLQDAALDPSGGSWPAMLLDYGLTYVISTVSGLLTGIVFCAAAARWGAAAGVWWGILTLPLTVGPIFAVLALIAGLEGPWPDRAMAYVLPNVDAVLAVGFGLVVLMAVVFALIARRTAIARPRT